VGSLLFDRAEAAVTERFGFSEIKHGVDETHHTAKGYTTDILIRWGDPLIDGAPDFDPAKQTCTAIPR